MRSRRHFVFQIFQSDMGMLLLMSSFGFFLCLCLPQTSSEISSKIDSTTYLDQRRLLIDEEMSRMIGSDVILSPEEAEVNARLMKYKDEEMQIGFKALNFSPSESFFLAREKINQSPVYSIIKEMPKGAALHLHELGLASVEWVISEITYWEDLYICNRTGSPLLFKFFDTPDSTCDWELVGDVRANYSDPRLFDQLLMESISITTDDPEEYGDINAVWSAFQAAFASIDGLVSYVPAWESYLNRILYEFMEDNVVYIEFRGVLSPLYEKNGTTYSDLEAFRFYEKVINNFTSSNRDNFFGAKYILTALKIASVEDMWKKVQLIIDLRNAFPEIVAGFDLVGQEDPLRPLIEFIDPLLYLSNQKPTVPVFYHAGETNWHGMASDENLLDAVLLNSTRIGHGYAITKHPLALQKAREANIPVEVCPISNQVLMLVDDLRNHPMAALASDGFPMVVSSDDPAMWGADPLSHDFYEAFYALGGAKADLRFLKKLALNSIDYSSLNNSRKEDLRKLWQKKWNDFIQSEIIKTKSNLEMEIMCTK